jgi:hypothetical protein
LREGTRQAAAARERRQLPHALEWVEHEPEPVGIMRGA